MVLWISGIQSVVSLVVTEVACILCFQTTVQPFLTSENA